MRKSRPGEVKYLYKFALVIIWQSQDFKCGHWGHHSQWLPDSYTLLLLRSPAIPQECPPNLQISSLKRELWVNPVLRANEDWTLAIYIMLESFLNILIYFCHRGKVRL